MESLESELDRARALDVSDLADAIASIGFECTRCGACCKADADDPHTATVFPDEVRELTDGDRDWRDVARPMPYGLDDGTGETFEWALQTDDCGDCTFYEESDGTGRCTVHEDRPLICETYPFSIKSLSDDIKGGMGTTEPMGGVVDHEGMVRAHECEGLGRDISREDAEELAAALKERAIRELEEGIGVRDNYEPTDVDGVVVHDSEGQKRPDGTPLEGGD
jgi:Fe-S-cluster containining protein